jgi:multimeric flavodoxin WrbA
MNVTVITGSPHAEGTTALLADEFCKGAEEKGHEVFRFNSAFKKIGPCMGCFYCHQNNGSCAIGDDMNQLYPHLLKTDALVLVTPLYYFDMTAQLKTALDRFFCVNQELRKMPIKLYVIAAAGNPNEWVYDGFKAHMATMCRFMNWRLSETLLINNAHTREDLTEEHRLRARLLGENLN